MPVDRSILADNDAERARLRALVGRLGDTDLARPLDAGWTVAGVLAHLAFWDQRIIVLLDEWEPGLTWTTLEPMLAGLRAAVGPLLDRAIERSGPAPDVLREPVDVTVQAVVAREIAERLGFDFKAGRLDEAVHPSTIRVGPGDVRLTTRFRPDAFAPGLFATLHELGHGLYEQYLPGEHFGAPVGEAPSLGLHEAQGRLLENHLGRCRAFWRYLWPRVAPRFGGAL